MVEDKNVSKDKHYLAYWKNRHTEIERSNRVLEKEAKSKLPRIISILTERYGASRILLFGSLKKGGFTDSSDIDIAVEGIKAKDFFAALAAVNQIGKFAVDLKPLEDLKPYFRTRVYQDGKIIYEKNNLI